MNSEIKKHTTRERLREMSYQEFCEWIQFNGKRCSQNECNYEQGLVVPEKVLVRFKASRSNEEGIVKKINAETIVCSIGGYAECRHSDRGCD